MKYTLEDQKTYFETAKAFIKDHLSVDQYDLLIRCIQYHEWKYAVQNDPIITDFEYDQLFDKLKQIELKNPSKVRKDSPTQRVATDLKDHFFSVPHLIPMLSLGNSYNEDDLIDFDSSVRKNAKLTSEDQVYYTIEPKYDGGSIALIYEDDVLIRAATRGNGTEGEEMTANAKAMRSIPLKAAFSKFGIHKVELRGEALIRKDLFHLVNEKRAASDLSLFANPRNAATGGLRTKDANETSARGIETFVFQIGYAIDQNGNDKLQEIKTHFNAITMLADLGFKTPGEGLKLCKTIKEASDFANEWEAKRESYDYEIDGMVIKVNDLQLQDIIGVTQHHPRWAIAFKFKAKQATTRLIGVEYQVGKVGSITPVAKLEPVSLAGVTVSSVSLHNEDFISSRDLMIGDTVLVERAGDVIPYIVKAMKELRDGSEQKIEFPKYCPADQDKKIALIREEGESAWRCPDPMCSAQRIQKLIFHVSKDAMNIDGFGKSNVEKFFELGWLEDLSRVYDLDYTKISALEGFGSKSVEKLQASIERAKANPISRLLHSLSIHHLGKKAGKILASEVNHVLDFVNWDEEKYETIKEIGPVLAKNMVAFFSSASNIELLQRMEAYGVNLKQLESDKPKDIDESSILYGKTILFTGSLQKMKRKEAQQLAEINGAKNISAVSSNLDILVVGEKAGSKLKKAQALGTVKIYTELEFLELLNA